MKRKTARRSRHEEILKAHARVEDDLYFWLEHVVHWHLALFALILILTVAYAYLHQPVVYAAGL